MKSNIPQITAALKKATITFGKENVKTAINTCLGFCHTYGHNYQLTLWKEYVIIAPKGSTNSLEQADLVFDLKAGKTIIDNKGLILNDYGMPEGFMEEA